MMEEKLGREVLELFEEDVDASSLLHQFVKENKHMSFDAQYQSLEKWFDMND